MENTNKQIFINLPVSDLAKSEEFYAALGFTKNPMFSNEDASSMMWGENIFVMLLKSDFYQKFLKAGQTIGNAKAASNVLLALTVNSREEVQNFADAAKTHGGDYFMAEPNKNLDFMFSYEVSDPDGHTWEPVFMDESKFPKQ